MRRVVVYLGWIGTFMALAVVAAEVFARLVGEPHVLGQRWLDLFYTPFDLLWWNTSLVIHGPQMQWVLAGFAVANATSLAIWAFLYGRTIKKAGTSFGSSRFRTTKELHKEKAFSPGPIPIGLSDEARYKSRIVTMEEELARPSLQRDQEILRKVRTKKTVYRLRKPGRIVYNTEIEHIMGIASSGGGKGISLVLPFLKTWPYSVVTYDIKKENWDRSAAHRSAFSDPIRFEPASFDTPRWNPMFEIKPGPREISDAMMLGEILASLDAEKQDDDYWATSAARTLSAYILYVLYHPVIKEKSLYTVYSLLTSSNRVMDMAEMALFPAEGLTDLQKQTVKYFSDIANGLLQMGANELSGVMGTSISKVQLFADPAVRRATSVSDFTVPSLVYERRTKSLYIVVLPGDSDRLRPLTRALFLFIAQKLMLDSVEKVATRHPLFLCMDEFASLGKMSFFETQLAYFRGFKIFFMPIVQAFNQVYRIYGERTSIPDNCKTKIILGIDGAKEANEVSDYLGVGTVVRGSTGKSVRANETFEGTVSENLSEGARKLLLPDEIMSMAFDDILILQSKKRPYRGKKIMEYADKRFRTDPRLTRPDSPEQQKVYLTRVKNPWAEMLDRPYSFGEEDLQRLPLPVKERLQIRDRKKAPENRSKADQGQDFKAAYETSWLKDFE